MSSQSSPSEERPASLGGAAASGVSAQAACAVVSASASATTSALSEEKACEKAINILREYLSINDVKVNAVRVCLVDRLVFVAFSSFVGLY